MKAFPSKTHSDDFHQHFVEKGMDLRDYFAGLAMQAIVSNDHAMNHINRVYKGIPVVRGVSMLSYEYADAMMEARNDQR